jgi:hypothetical protein
MHPRYINSPIRDRTGGRLDRQVQKMPSRPFAKLKLARRPQPVPPARFELPAWSFRSTKLATKRPG